MTNSTSARQLWWLGAQGQALVAAESLLTAESLDNVFGWEMLQLGGWGYSANLLASCRTRRHAVAASLAEWQDGAKADLIARASQLPIASDSLDAVLLPHTLESATDPYAVVREVDRVLTGEGQLLILGFRPFSLWGLRGRMARAGFPPGIKRLLPERQVRDWLRLLGYEVANTRRYLYDLPWGVPRPAQEVLRRSWLHWWSAGAYLIKARKRVYTLTPIRPKFRERTQPIGGLVKPTTRSSS